MILAAFVSFFAFLLVLWHLPNHWMRRLVGHKGWVDLILHGTILWMFLGTSTMGLLQAEAAGICFSLYLRAYAGMRSTQRMVYRKGRIHWYDVPPEWAK